MPIATALKKLVPSKLKHSHKPGDEDKTEAEENFDEIETFDVPSPDGSPTREITEAEMGMTGVATDKEKEEIAELKTSDKVDSELEALKARFRKPAANTGSEG